MSASQSPSLGATWSAPLSPGTETSRPVWAQPMRPDSVSQLRQSAEALRHYGDDQPSRPPQGLASWSHQGTAEGGRPAPGRGKRGVGHRGGGQGCGRKRPGSVGVDGRGPGVGARSPCLHQISGAGTSDPGSPAVERAQVKSQEMHDGGPTVGRWALYALEADVARFWSMIWRRLCLPEPHCSLGTARLRPAAHGGGTAWGTSSEGH